MDEEIKRNIAASDDDTRANIVIVGGGISGLATALALHRKGIKSLVLERSKTLMGDKGPAIIMQPNGWRALDQLGVASSLRQTAIPVLSGQFSSLDNNKVHQLPIGKEELRCLKGIDLVNSLADCLPHNTIRFGCYVLSVELDPITSSPVLHLQDGTVLNAKVVIGCDGVDSTISNMIGVAAEAVFTVCVVRGCTSYPIRHNFGNEFHMTKKGHVQVGVMPMTTNRIYWFITRKYSYHDHKISKSQKLIWDLAVEIVKDFPSRITQVVRDCSLELLHLSDYLRCQAPLDMLHKNFRLGTVTVAGDALHAMAPFLAQGESASLEDAVVLARCLARKTIAGPTGSSIGRKAMVEEAFEEYLKERKPRVLRLCLQSYLVATMHETSSKVVRIICIVLLVIFFRDSNAHTLYDCGSL